MTLAPGTRLGPYEITAPLGVGGMGEVYRATDTNLKRQVAIKVLPAAVANDPQRLARFQREAEILAALNHPNIAHIHGLEKLDGSVALLMELVEGPTLADRIAQGPIPIEDALPIAKQIAEALEAAHEQHIIHRDLKPANIKVRDDGTVKVLDFGLAKALGPAETGGPHADLSMSPTITSPAMTQAGVILGTAAYMSPEQAKGRAVDKRADIWAFGCVVYEMLTAKRPFAGEDISDTLASVLKSELDWHVLPSDVPRPLVRLLRRCLEKDPRRRLRDIGEARVLIDDHLAGKLDDGRPAEGQATSGTDPRDHRGSSRTWLIATAAAIVAAAATGLVAWFSRPAPAPTPIKRLAINLPVGETFSAIGRKFIAISRDGSRLAYVANGQLYVRALDQLAATPVNGTTAATSPFFSPDGQWIGFWQTGQLKKVAITGGAPAVLCDALNPFGASWSDDGTILFGQGPGGISRVPEGGGEPSVVIALNKEKGESAYGPELLPDGKSILFAVVSVGTDAAPVTNGWDDAQIVVQSIGSGERTVVVRGGEPHYVPAGHLLYVRQGVLTAVPFDATRRRTTGNPVSIVDSVRSASIIQGVSAGGFNSTTGAAQFAVSDSGLLAYVEASPGLSSETRPVVWVDRQGQESPISNLPPRAYVYPRISPDGKRLAVDIRDQDQDIWVYDFDRGTLVRLTFDKGPDIGPVWSPDGQRIVFFKSGQGVFSQLADGTGVADRLTTSGLNLHAPTTFTSDGKGLLFQEQVSGRTNYKIRLLDLAAKRITNVLPDSPFSESNAALSPDGRWLAYQAAPPPAGPATPPADIFVRPFPNVEGGKWQISGTGGGTRPVWSRNGRELFYLAEGRNENADTMMAVTIDATAGFRAGVPTKLFAGPYFSTLSGPIYDVAPDAQRFVMIKRSSTPAGSVRIIVVDNWTEELKPRVTNR